jgi:hypothetical protein
LECKGSRRADHKKNTRRVTATLLQAIAVQGNMTFERDLFLSTTGTAKKIDGVKGFPQVISTAINP